MNKIAKPILQLFNLTLSLVGLVTFLILGVGLILYLDVVGVKNPIEEKALVKSATEPVKSNALIDPAEVWTAPDWAKVDSEPNADEIKYGKELIANTAEYLGPNGKVKKISNGLNCQNCHLQAGTAPLGNNYLGVASTYPKVRGRSGHSEDVVMRINGCFQRSLNGESLPKNSKEMKAMVAYMNWLGQAVPKGQKPTGAGIYEVPVLDRAADPILGKVVYQKQCVTCHGEDGQGMMKADQTGYIYPPLWGANSYNQRAGLFRISKFAGYVKANMPFGATYENPILTDEEAWDVAAYVNSLQRPDRDFPDDWPDISKKPMDHPFGPYADEFSENQHKYGPFKEIIAAQKP
ncbi:c-type cytochrome [Algoriphagus halophytocola]|uniref:C-type cytochrome n=1 Tax=Algoriphagus halophytocola TaxID=2991499 RepID=A0ABY6MJY7_9BACT|nr:MULTISPECIES: c-type cytochrome [unclassified Algoriphagus]UZD22509.1 c-type cytochrome [Algoriphagus sp. TR-M5]WBL43771.1 c-type cytochrome [Algoriphagus sp. TR-M9]